MPNNFIADKKRLFQGIGETVVQFQFLEHEVAEVLASLLQMHHPSDTHRITAAMSFGQKVDLMCDLYPSRKNPDWPSVDLRLTRSVLKVAEAFRNTVVHSFWHLGTERHWMRTKANLRRKDGLNVSTGVVSLDALEEGAKCLSVVRDWYLGSSDQVEAAADRLEVLARELSTAGD